MKLKDSELNRIGENEDIPNGKDVYILKEVIKSELPKQTVSTELYDLYEMPLKKAKEISFQKRIDYRGSELPPIINTPVKEEYLDDPYYYPKMPKHLFYQRHTHSNGVIETISRVEHIKPLDDSSIYIPEGETSC